MLEVISTAPVPEIAAGSPSRMHTTVSACLSLISYCAPIDLQFKRLELILAAIYKRFGDAS